MSGRIQTAGIVPNVPAELDALTAHDPQLARTVAAARSMTPARRAACIEAVNAHPELSARAKEFVGLLMQIVGIADGGGA